MQHLFIDTNILEGYPYYRNQEYQTLQLLENNGLIKLHLPWVVEMEYIQHRQKDFNRLISSARKKIEELEDSYWVKKEWQEKIKEIYCFLNAIEKGVVNKIKDDFQKRFVEELKVEKEDVDPNRILNTIRAFYANLCDRSKKDIPDAFIAEYIKAWYSNNVGQSVVVLSQDKRLLDDCKKLGMPFSNFDSIQAFIVDKKLSNYSHSDLNGQGCEQIIVQHLKDTESEDFLKSLYMYFDRPNSVAFNELIEVRCNSQKTIEFDSCTLGVPVRCSFEVVVDLCVLWSDYYAECFKKYKIVDLHERNEHYCDITFLHTVHLEAMAVIERLQHKNKIKFQDICVLS